MSIREFAGFFFFAHWFKNFDNIKSRWFIKGRGKEMRKFNE